MGFRPDLDLTSILALHESPLPSPEEVEAMRKAQEPDDSLRYETPVRLGWGPARWSTSMALVPVDRVCHDVNGYYRELGVDWRATRKELREAYLAKDGQSSARLTYVFKQLLDPLTREAYDKSPKGEPFLDDYTEDDLKRRAHQEAAKRSTLGQAVSAEQVLDDWGYVPLDDSEEGVDSVRAIRKDLPRKAATASGRENFRYSYYAWKTEQFIQDTGRLKAWQEHLSKAASRVGASPEVAIGLTSMVRLSDQWFMIELVDGKPVVFFFTDVEPTTEIAEQALAEFLQFP
jgi:hypothetical protein